MIIELYSFLILQGENMSVLTKQERSYVVDSWSLVTPDLQNHGSQFIIM